jgi:dTDP-4-dehydrorhamnose reductase
MKAAYAILGAAGQLGRELCQRLGDQAAALTRAEADLTNPEMVRAALAQLRPAVVFNCAAFNFVDRAESERAAALAVNHVGAGAVAEICRELGATCVHCSTDYVFGADAARTVPYKVTDRPGPINAYGMSKLAGEEAVREAGPRHLIVRTCGLYGLRGGGGKGGNFVETMLRLAGAGQSPRVVADQICTPTSAGDLAGAMIELVQAPAFGTHHLTNAGACSWFEFARAIFELAGATAEVTPIASCDWPAPARRPAYSVLECTKSLRHWREALAEYLKGRV